MDNNNLVIEKNRKTFEKIKEILASEEFDEADKAVVLWQFRLNGDFKTALWNAIMLADERNLTYLSLGFPVEVGGYKKWTQGDLGRRLRDKGLMI